MYNPIQDCLLFLVIEDDVAELLAIDGAGIPVSLI